jgi:hypothetical protein
LCFWDLRHWPVLYVFKGQYPFFQFSSVLPLMTRKSFKELDIMICWITYNSFDSGSLLRHCSNIFSIICPPLVVVAEIDLSLLILMPVAHPFPLLDQGGDLGEVKEKATGFIVYLRLLGFTIIKWQKKKATGFW